jgi:hypothetical protein
MELAKQTVKQLWRRVVASEIGSGEEVGWQIVQKDGWEFPWRKVLTPEAAMPLT